MRIFCLNFTYINIDYTYVKCIFNNIHTHMYTIYTFVVLSETKIYFIINNGDMCVISATTST